VRQKTRLLAAVNARLRRMEKTKNQFLFNIGHELKSPLAVIEMNLATIMGGKATAKQVKESGRMINRNLLRLKQKIEEIIQLSRFEHGRQVQKDDLDFSELVREVAETYLDFASVKKAKLHVEGADRRRLVVGDRHLLQYALGNLFSNAVKYCDRRDIYVKVAQDGKNVVFSIANSGVGIKPENRHKLFDRFFKEDQNSPGTGVGLFITREIARSHSGNVWYEPGKPRGAVFYFSIPVAERRDMYGKK